MSEVNLHKCDQERWKIAQERESFEWGGEACGDGDDHFDYWQSNFDNYSFLKGKHFGHTIEVACGPYARGIRHIMSLITYDHLYVLDPLLETYCKRNQSGVARFLSTVAGTGILSTLEAFTQSNQFDLVLCNNAIDHCFDADLVFKNLHNMLKPNGIVVFGNDLKCREDMEIARDAAHPIMVEQDYLDGQFQKYGFEEVYKKVVGREEVRNPSACCGAYFGAFRKVV